MLRESNQVAHLLASNGCSLGQELQSALVSSVANHVVLYVDLLSILWDVPPSWLESKCNLKC